MGGSMKIDLRKIIAAGVLVAGLAVPAHAGAGPGKEKAPPRSHPAPTVEPAPPLSLDIRLVNLQKNSRGGVATLSLDTGSTLELDEVTLSVKLPEGVVFSDGTRNKSWTFSIGSGGTYKIPADLLVAEDGKFLIPADISGSYQGKGIHRGSSFKLLVGVQEKNPQTKDGAIEYPGVPGGGI